MPCVTLIIVVPLSLELANGIEPLRDQFRGGGRGDFVEQHVFRRHRQSAGNGEVLLLNAGEAGGKLVDMCREPEMVEMFTGEIGASRGGTVFTRRCTRAARRPRVWHAPV